MSDDYFTSIREMWNNIRNYGTRRPAPADLLYKNLIENKTVNEVLASVSSGCGVIISNARRLVGDVNCLIAESRFSSASMLSATVEEEIAKVLLLLDLSRLDFMKHDNLAKDLCKAFCNHTAKAARFSLFRDWQIIGCMAKAKQYTASYKIEWFPADPDTGQPDLASAHAYRRDHSLYADIDWTTGQWHMPDDQLASTYFARDFRSTWPRTLQILEQLERNCDASMFSKTVLSVLQEEYSPYVISERSDGCVERISIKIAARLVDDGFTKQETVYDAPIIMKPPMYAFIGKSLQNLRRS